MHVIARLKRIIEIIKEFKGEVPLHDFLKNYFRLHKEMGSTDRRIASDTIYRLFRLGKALCHHHLEERMAAALFLTGQSADPLINHVLSNCSSLPVEAMAFPLDEKLRLVKKIYSDFNENDLFPFNGLSKGCDRHLMSTSMLIQPAVWLRLRKDRLDSVIRLLDTSTVSFIQEGQRLMLDPGVDPEKIGISKDWYEVQDRSSQLTGNFFNASAGEVWLDCCAASGGKSLLLHSITPDVQLTVCDIRQSSLKNLAERFKRNGIEKYISVVADLTKSIPPELTHRQFDGIIADVPCCGSGTWSRTPEQATFYNQSETERYNELQWNIIRNISPLLKAEKPLIYITCSVFSSENEVMTERICQQLNFRLEKEELITGYHHRADNLFVARLIKNS